MANSGEVCGSENCRNANWKILGYPFRNNDDRHSPQSRTIIISIIKWPSINSYWNGLSDRINWFRFERPFFTLTASEKWKKKERRKIFLGQRVKTLTKNSHFIFRFGLVTIADGLMTRNKFKEHFYPFCCDNDSCYGNHDYFFIYRTPLFRNKVHRFISLHYLGFYPTLSSFTSFPLNFQL